LVVILKLNLKLNTWRCAISLRKVLLVGLALPLVVFATAACEKEDSAEMAGKEIDRAMDNAKKKLDEATK
jgi:hypothetical protein